MMETYYGQVRTPADAIKLFEACRLGLLPRVQRRLSEKERGAIRSGSVFVWDEREAGMRRWTDGKSWSASRVSGSFLTYREMEGKRGSGFGGTRRGAGKTPESGRGSDEDREDGEPEGYRYKADGLLKQSFSITTSSGQHLHLISYYSPPRSGQPDLPQPTSDPSLRHITPLKGLYPESSLHDSNPTPALTRAPMLNSTYGLSQASPQAPAYSYTQYAQQTSYGWPPSPAATPPFAHMSGYPQQPSHPIASQPLMYQQHQQQPPLPQHGGTLPPLNSQPRTTLPPCQHQVTTSPHASYVRPADSPRSHHHHHHHHHHHQHSSISASPHASHLPPTSDPLAPTSSRALPALGPMATASTTPPMRTHSVSPPRSAHGSDVFNSSGNAASTTPLSISTSNKTSISSLLHATPGSSEPSSANPASASSSPRTLTTAAAAAAAVAGNRALPPIVDHEPGFSEDMRTRNLLNRKFCI